jgi:hypothetical protein
MMPVDVVDAQRHDVSRSQAKTRQEQQHGTVANAGRRRRIARADQRLYLGRW